IALAPDVKSVDGYSHMDQDEWEYYCIDALIRLWKPNERMELESLLSSPRANVRFKAAVSLIDLGERHLAMPAIEEVANGNYPCSQTANAILRNGAHGN